MRTTLGATLATAAFMAASSRTARSSSASAEEKNPASNAKVNISVPLARPVPDRLAMADVFEFMFFGDPHWQSQWHLARFVWKLINRRL